MRRRLRFERAKKVAAEKSAFRIEFLQKTHRIHGVGTVRVGADSLCAVGCKHRAADDDGDTADFAFQ